MEVCCLLGICCPPAQRKEKALQHFLSLGLGPKEAETAADELLKAVDHLLAMSPAAIIADAKEHGK